MVDRISTRNQHAAAGLLNSFRQQNSSSTRISLMAAVPSTSYHTLSASSPHDSFVTSISVENAHRSFSTSSTISVSAHRKQAGREKARLRSMRMEEKILRRREKDFPTAPPSSSSNSRRPFSRDPIEEETESTIREYMARTGPKGQRLTLSQQERLLKQELTSLNRQLEKIEKKEKADEAVEELPELDDNVLEEIYQALMLPPPPTAEESRLAQLESGRREKMLLEAGGGRGRKRLDRPRGVEQLLPPTGGEQRMLRTSMDLKQKLIHAREKGRMLLPPSTSNDTRPPTPAELEPPQDEELVQGEMDLAALPYAERQEIRLQQLFARLALVHSNPDPTVAGHGEESLRQIKSSLASRIANILKEHQYELPSSFQHPDSQQKDVHPTQAATEEPLPPFETVRLDGKAPTIEAATTAQNKERDAIVTAREHGIDLVAQAEMMISNLDSAESRNFILDSIEKLVPVTSSSSSETPATIPLGVASIDEWTALAVASARAADATTLDRTLSLMQRSGYIPTLSLYNDVLDAFASSGNLSAVQHYLAQMSSLGLSPDNHTHHSMVKAYMKSSQYLPAISLLNSLEASGTPAAMATYTLLINRLLDSVDLPNGAKESRDELQALTWNMFYHMRLTSHPVPDAPLYALMIRACAKGVPQPHDVDVYRGKPTMRFSDAERALDLFREMTTRYSVRPNAEVYNSLILACARRKDFYLEAFRLLREMVELETERSSLSSEEEGGVKVLRFAPDRYTFNALLQGCARNRDLARARWVLAEMIRTSLPLFDEEVRGRLGREEVVELLSKRANEETMVHVFHAYAAYVAPLQRGQLQIQSSNNAQSTFTSGNDKSFSTDAADASEVLQDTKTTANSNAVSVKPTTDLEKPQQQQEDREATAEEAAAVFSSLVPQTSSDLISESRSLFARILADQPQPATDSHGKIFEGPLGGVNPGVRLVNAYLTVLAAHLPWTQKAYALESVLAPKPLNGAEQMLELGLFARLGLAPNEHSFRIILEALSDSPFDSAKAVEAVWARFEQFLAFRTAPQDGESSTELVHGQSGKQDELVDAIQVKKCYSAYVHYLCKTSSAISSPDSNKGSDNDDGLNRAMTAFRCFVERYPPKVGVKKSKHAIRRAKTAMLSKKNLPSLDLSPLPVPIKSLQTLQSLQNNISSSLSSDHRVSNSSNTPNAIMEPSLGDKEEAEDANPTLFRGMTARPTLHFLDVQLLHHRLVRYGRVKDLAYLSWVLHRYNAASLTP
ncbi:uncharacterized protein MEPE_01196 [Melanopsichium pennsylvanicum]|uniref:Uncharacterized protein n=2 Tax=Melanopsichium pennsylvanicum TaxID=63383 RepID=A0AAJ4XHC4_9BASI|nr:conserved hypothetical protein [Melanopsichium pennsylvanicum 4]SNX82490.1 uncharacterized protein MEPE_01196 [Melanopsichium pennsylvanicum]